MCDCKKSCQWQISAITNDRGFISTLSRTMGVGGIRVGTSRHIASEPSARPTHIYQLVQPPPGYPRPAPTHPDRLGYSPPGHFLVTRSPDPVRPPDAPALRPMDPWFSAREHPPSSCRVACGSRAPSHGPHGYTEFPEHQPGNLTPS